MASHHEDPSLIAGKFHVGFVLNKVVSIQEDFQMDASNYKTQRKTQAKKGRQCNTGYSSTEHQKLESLCPRSCKMEKRR
jgi:hypothetical protein